MLYQLPFNEKVLFNLNQLLSESLPHEIRDSGTTYKSSAKSTLKKSSVFYLNDFIATITNT